MPLVIDPQNYEQNVNENYSPITGFGGVPGDSNTLIFTLSEEIPGVNNTTITREDPLKNMNYVVGFNPYDNSGTGTPAAEIYWYGFATMSGLSHSTESVGYRESGDDNFEHSSPGKGTFEPIVLKKGMGKHVFLYMWARRIVQINAKDDLVATLPQSTTNFFDYRCHHVRLIIRDSGLRAAKAFKIYQPWCKKHEIGELDSMGNDILFETIELGHEGYQQFVVSIDATTGLPTPQWNLPIGY